ncbi:hypothetical protein M2103_002282 [Ereboglobus sp. PH5-5]|uniref:hypothetical protein n=1 Tax=unclassified Ereboglobus TaxID=2626932 RepID=UPI0029E4674C|nr:hypothetical protein [Ereboglobus sp. PH5-10]MDF9834047.1 hypothetical protein [Ereboglobus sp. PH5-5]
MTTLQSNRSERSQDFVKRSSLYQEFLAEREEILRHKWLESERLGYDIGFERALLDWIRKHREGWRTARRAQTPPCSANRQ